jgi:hypothetical protein
MEIGETTRSFHGSILSWLTLNAAEMETAQCPLLAQSGQSAYAQ